MMQRFSKPVCIVSAIILSFTARILEQIVTLGAVENKDNH
jgi:hypothetical protein